MLPFQTLMSPCVSFIKKYFYTKIFPHIFNWVNCKKNYNYNVGKMYSRSSKRVIMWRIIMRTFTSFHLRLVVELRERERSGEKSVSPFGWGEEKWRQDFFCVLLVLGVKTSNILSTSLHWRQIHRSFSPLPFTHKYKIL